MSRKVEEVEAENLELKHAKAELAERVVVMQETRRAEEISAQRARAATKEMAADKSSMSSLRERVQAANARVEAAEANTAAKKAFIASQDSLIYH